MSNEASRESSGVQLGVSAKQGATDSSKRMQGNLGAGDDANAQPMAPERSDHTLLLAVLEERLLSCVNLTAGMISSHPRHAMYGVGAASFYGFV